MTQNQRLKLEEILMRMQKPGRYVGGEQGAVIKDADKVALRFAMCFPDLYEVAMSHLGIKILYGLLNEREDTWCERCFAPGPDLEAEMRANGIPLYGLESMDSIAGFDMIGFSLQYEMCYTTMLNMLDLAGLPIRAADRKGLAPIVIAGGPCVCNPEPIADFVDICLPGEGEEVLPELCDLYLQCRAEGCTKEEFLRRAARIQGVYVPSLYRVEYHEDGRISGITALEDAPMPVKKRIVEDLDKVYYPHDIVVPFLDIVHNRAAIEVMRGCIRGCRFCQAGYLYRPNREKSWATLANDAMSLCDATGYEDLGLLSLSTSDYRELEPLLENLLPWTEKNYVGVSLPSLRVDNFSPKLLDYIKRVRKSGLTFAPEAGTQRMRDIINKNVTEEEVLRTCRTAFEGGYTSVKLYFMMGLPGETMEDVAGIIELAQKVVDLYYSIPERPKGKSVSVTCSVACFVPKPFTPFQFEPQDTREMLQEKQKCLLDTVKTKSRKINVNYHDAPVSRWEAVLARGDRRLCAVLESVWKQGGNLEGWNEYFDAARYEKAMAENGLTADFYASRRREYDEIMPWDHMDYGVSKEFLVREHRRALQEEKTTPNCREHCAGCGANKLIGGGCR
ncbi:MAG: TIGR03960 family B12-binding radical SAM protein [Oscillospiraceae bacterium]|nr:TIGR03960 family B12-binding radical SAM protein [Oscillospiraceae bacterium]